MPVHVTKWGHSLAIRIPKPVAEQAGIGEGTELAISVEGDRILLTPSKPRYTLEQLLEGLTPETAADAEWERMPPVGKEVW
jgi:antitoxin MazE